MSNYASLKNVIDQAITTNGMQAITGAILNDVLKALVSSLGAGYQFGGLASPALNPGTPDQNYLYFACEAGVYTYMGGFSLPKGISIIKWNGSWTAAILYRDNTGLNVDNCQGSDLEFSDPDNYILVKFRNGHIQTKNFDSETDVMPLVNVDKADLDFSDPDDNVLVSFSDGHIKTKYFDSRNFPYNKPGNIYYEGEKISLSPTMKSEKFCRLTMQNMQSMAQYGNILVCISDNLQYYIYNISNPESIILLGSGSLPYSGTTSVHGNMASFSNTFYNNNTIPLLYVSQWDGDKGVLVYNISSSYTLQQVQFIKPSSSLMLSATFGLGNTDFVCDKQNNRLYSIVYKQNSWAEDVTNRTCICEFLLPNISDGAVIELTESDIISSFEVENIPTRQDASILNGVLYICNGYLSPYYAAKLRVINLLSKSLINRIPLSSILNGEPEGLEANKDHIKLNFGSSFDIYKLTF